MKKLILFAAILFAGFSVVNAAGPLAKSVDVKLNVNLKSIQSIIVKSGQETVNLNYATPEDYLKGVASVQADHLQVFSTSKAFNVSVSAVAFTGGNTPIELSSINVAASVGSTNGLTDATYKSVNLSTVDGVIVSSSGRGKHNDISITYKGIGGDSFLDYLYNDGAETIHKTTVTYTITAQ